jgi:glycerol transport system ATP-binding protein
MATIELKNISHNYYMKRGDTPAAGSDLDTDFVIRDFNLVWQEGSANALLGPSGCGKTTILNIISGLLLPTMGEILYDGQDVTNLPPEKRHIAQVFQFPVVYDTISVYRNLAFPLKNAGLPKNEIKNRVEHIADILDLTDVLNISAGRISQANKQKVSLGRGIIREDTVAILFDEPLTVIDPKEKYILRRKIREVQKNLNITTIYVTHDQHEALTFADNVTVIKDGRIIQTGSPKDLHAEPASPFIGYFIGSPGMNLLDCTLNDQILEFGDFNLPLSANLRDQLNGAGPRLQFGIRPEFILSSNESKDGWIPWTADVVENVGSYKILTLSSNGLKIKSRASEHMTVKSGDRIWVSFPEENFKIFEGEKRVY